MKRTIVWMLALAAALPLLFASAGWAEEAHHGTSADTPKHCDMASCPHKGITAKIFENYFVIRASLAADSLEGVPTRAKAIAEAVEPFSQESNKCMGRREESNMHALMSEIGAAARTLAEKNNITSAREEFGELSMKMFAYQKSHLAESERAHVFACDMAKKMWLQQTEEPGNPYFGPAMARCGRMIE